MAGDALYSSVALLLHCNGTNGSTTFTDNSPTPKTVTATNGAQISTAQSKWGGASGLFDGTNDYLTVGTAPEWRFLHDDTTDFSIEGWVYWNGGASDLTIISTAAASANVGFYLQVLGSDSRKLNVQIYRGVGGNHLSATSSTGISSGAWTYFKFRYTKTTRAYAFRIGSSDAGSGTLAVTGTWPSSSTSDPTYTLAIGRYQYSTPDGYLNGYLDDLRITAAARTETTEPTEEFPHFPVIDAIASAPGPLGAFLGIAYITLSGIAQAESPLGAALVSGTHHIASAQAASPLGEARAVANMPLVGFAKADSPLGSARAAAAHDFSAALGDVVTRYVMDLHPVAVRVPISSWQATLQTGASCYVQCVIPACLDWADSIAAATEFSISRIADAPTAQIEYEMARSPIGQVSMARGPTNFTATLSGYAPAFAENEDPPNTFDRTLSDVRSVTTGTSPTRVRCAIDWLLRPGHRAYYGAGASFVVRYINYYVPATGDAYMDVGE